MKSSLIYKKPAVLTLRLASAPRRSRNVVDGPARDSWGGTDPAHISSIWTGSRTLKSFLPLSRWRAEKQSRRMWRVRRRHLISRACETLSRAEGLQWQVMIGNVENEDSRKYVAVTS